MKTKLEQFGIDIIARLSSRTFWITIITLVVLAQNNQWTEVAVVAVGYVGAEKGLDAVQTIRNKKAIIVAGDTTVQEEAPDISEIYTGSGRIKTFDEPEE